MKKRLKVVFIRPSDQQQTYGELDDLKLTALEPPVWAALLAAYCRTLIASWRGQLTSACDVLLFDEVVENWDHKTTAKKTAEEKPDLVVVVVSGTNPSASTPVMPAASELTHELKKLTDAWVMLLGLHPTALPERSLDESGADFVCLGEGFYTLADLILLLDTDRTDFDKARGLYFRGVSASQPPVFERVELLPQPAWDLVQLKNYRAHNWHCFDDIDKRSPYAAIYTSLGCPFGCSFCCIGSFFGKRMRYRTSHQVADEIKLLAGQGIRNIKITDEMFALNTERVKEVCEAISLLDLDLNIWAYARVNTVNPEQLRFMRTAGVKWLAYGIESGDDRVLDKASKSSTARLAYDSIKMTQDASIFVCGNYIFGLPGEDEDSMKRTLDLAMDLKTEWANFYSVIPYPGSKLYNDAVKSGKRLPDDWRGYSQYSFDCRPLPTEALDSQRILEFRDHAFSAYYTDASYLKTLKNKFGQRAVDHVAKMMEHSMTRHKRE
jgi:anaerobic magnesium-protoporphyrin IX monomethyl ester cyclase